MVHNAWKISLKNGSFLESHISLNFVASLQQNINIKNIKYSNHNFEEEMLNINEMMGYTYSRRKITPTIVVKSKVYMYTL